MRTTADRYACDAIEKKDRSLRQRLHEIYAGAASDAIF
jgi:hypothetical protein